jgi:hypothetical protein
MVEAGGLFPSATGARVPVLEAFYSKATLTVPASVAPADLRVRLRAQAIGGGGGTTTPTLIVPPGQQVYWTIGSDPSMSTASAG